MLVSNYVLYDTIYARFLLCYFHLSRFKLKVSIALTNERCVLCQAYSDILVKLLLCLVAGYLHYLGHWYTSSIHRCAERFSASMRADLLIQFRKISDAFKACIILLVAGWGRYVELIFAEYFV